MRQIAARDMANATRSARESQYASHAVVQLRTKHSCTATHIIREQVTGLHTGVVRPARRKMSVDLSGLLQYSLSSLLALWLGQSACCLVLAKRSFRESLVLVFQAIEGSKGMLRCM